jgi:hypothetical protein
MTEIPAGRSRNVSVRSARPERDVQPRDLFAFVQDDLPARRIRARPGLSVRHADNPSFETMRV